MIKFDNNPQTIQDLLNYANANYPVPHMPPDQYRHHVKDFTVATFKGPNQTQLPVFSFYRAFDFIKNKTELYIAQNAFNSDPLAFWEKVYELISESNEKIKSIENIYVSYNNVVSEYDAAFIRFVASQHMVNALPTIFNQVDMDHYLNEFSRTNFNIVKSENSISWNDYPDQDIIISKNKLYVGLRAFSSNPQGFWECLYQLIVTNPIETVYVHCVAIHGEYPAYLIKSAADCNRQFTGIQVETSALFLDPNNLYHYMPNQLS